MFFETFDIECSSVENQVDFKNDGTVKKQIILK